MQRALPAKGLPSLQFSSARRARQPRGRAQNVLQRTWTLRTGGVDRGSVAAAAFPLPFMEISVSVLDTLDMMANSVEEEIVFQATMQVPAHHAFACRVEAYNSPFATAPALTATPGQLSEEDKQFAACLASPAEIDEAHELNPMRNLGGNAASSFVGRTAPSLRVASGALTVALSLRQRSNDHKDAEREGDEDEDEDILAHTLLRANEVGSAPNCVSSLQSVDIAPGELPPPQAAASAATAAGAGISASSSDPLPASRGSFSFSRGAGGRRALGVGECSAIPEAVAGEEDGGAAPAALPPAARPAGRALGALPCTFSFIQRQQHKTQEPRQQQQQEPRPHGLLRIESITSAGRRCEEVPLTTRLANKGVATLLGVGYMLLHSLESRTAPASTLLQYQVDAFAGRPATPNSALLPPAAKTHCSG